MLGLEALQRFDDVVHPSGPRVVERAAAERGEAGGEDHAGIGRIRVPDDAFVEAIGECVKQRQHKAVGEVGVGGAGDGGFLRFALLPCVDALAGLLAEVAAIDQLLAEKEEEIMQV